jgi:hypothetical protein
LQTYYGFIISSASYISGQTGLGLKEMVLWIVSTFIVTLKDGEKHTFEATDRVAFITNLSRGVYTFTKKKVTTAISTDDILIFSEVPAPKAPQKKM